MPAGTGPIGTIRPTTPAPQQDAAKADAEEKNALKSSEADAKAKEAKSKDTDEDALEESDLDTLEEGKKVPYSRFKEVNERAKQAQRALEEREREFEAQRRKDEELAELRVRARLEKESAQANEFLTDEERDRLAQKSEMARLKEELGSLKTRLESQSVEEKIRRLEGEYPEADSLAVLGWARQLGSGADLDELMERSHNRNLERAQKAVRSIIERKKAKAKQALPTHESGLRLKDSDRPKNLADSHNLVRRLLGSD